VILMIEVYTTSSHSSMIVIMEVQAMEDFRCGDVIYTERWIPLRQGELQIRQGLERSFVEGLTLNLEHWSVRQMQRCR
jgi:hypothetical protein